MPQGNITQIEQDNADVNLTTLVTVFSGTPDASNIKQCICLIELGDGVKDVDGVGGDFLLTVEIGGQVVQPSLQVITVEASQAQIAFFTAPFVVPANALVEVKVESPNGADSDVDATATIFDVGPLSIAQISAQIAADLETYDGPTKAELDSAVAPLALEATVAALNNLSVADIAAELATYDAPTLAEVERILRVTNRLIESQRSEHTGQGNIYFVDPINGDTHANGNRGGIDDPYLGVQDCHDNAVTDSNHDIIILVAGDSGLTTLTEDVSLTKRYLFIRGPGRDFLWTRSGAGDTIAVTGDGIELCGFQVETAGVGAGDGISVSTSDFFKACNVWINDTRGHGILLNDCDNFILSGVSLQGAGVSGAGHGIFISAGSGETANFGDIHHCHINNVQGDGIRLDPSGGGSILQVKIHENGIQGCTSDGIHIVDSSVIGTFIHDNRFGNNSAVNINDGGTNTLDIGNTLVADIWDEVLSAATHNVPASSGRRLREVQESQYANGAIWIDTVNGTAGTTEFENGTAKNPVDSIEDANTLAASLGLGRFEVAPGSNITFTAAQENQEFRGRSWILAFGGQSIDGTTITGAHLSGICTGGGEQNLIECHLNGCTLPATTHLLMCGFGGIITLGEAGDLFFHQCYSGIAGTATPSLDFGAGIGDSNVSVRNYSGGLEIRNMNVAGSDTLSFEGRGQLVIASSCVGGTVAIRGLFTVTDNASAAVTLSDDARFDIDQINAAADLAISDAALATAASIAALNNLSSGEANAAADLAISDAALATAASIAALNNITAANVWAVTIADLVGMLGDDATALEVLTFIKHFFHDKQVMDDSEGTQKIYNGAGVLIGTINFTAAVPATSDLTRAKAV